MVIEKSFVVSKLKELNGHLLKSHYKKLWTKNNPTLGYCYLVSEALYHYLDHDTKAYCISMESGTHWYVEVDGKIIDYTSDQFNNPVDYNKGVRKGFFKGSIKTNKGFISKRGHEMAKHLNLTQR